MDARRAAALALLGSCVLLVAGCQKHRSSSGVSIVFDQIPPSGVGGAEELDPIRGRVIDGPADSRIVVYAHNSDWWVQPFRSRPFTHVGGEGRWSTATHPGSDYAALLVTPGFRPEARLETLPKVGGNVLGVSFVKGSSAPKQDAKILHFSGYDWKVKSSEGDHGGELSEYEPSNAWVDDHGYLHLLMGQVDGQWHCAGISLTRSLGYGTYRFVVQDSAQLPPSAVFTLFTHDDRQDERDQAEMDIELSHWGRAYRRNADYVIQPYYIPENTVHFNVPAGPMTYLLRWDPGSAVFKSFRGESAATPGRKVMEHIFRSGVPVPSAETVHLDLYDFHHSQSGLQHPVEVVVEKFEYLP